MPLVSPPSFFKKNLLSDVLLLLLVLLVIAHVKINAINTDSSNNNITTIPNNTNINNNTNNSSTTDSQYNSASEYNEIILLAYGITLLGILFLNRPVALTSIEFAAAVLAVAPPSRSDDGSSSTSIVSYEYLISLSTENIFFYFPASSSSSSPLPLDENNNSTTFTLSPYDQNNTTTTSIISTNDDNSALVDRLQKRFGSLILVFLLTYLILLVVSFLGVSCVYFFLEKKKRKSSRSDHSSTSAGDGEVKSSRNSSSDSYFSNSSSTQTLIIKYLLRRTLQVLRIPSHIMSVLVQFVVCSMCFQSGALLALDDESDFNRFAFALTLALYVVSGGAIMYVGILKLQVIEPLREDAIDTDRVEVINKLAMSGCLPPLLGGKEDNEKKKHEQDNKDDSTNEGENSTLQRGSSRRFHFSSQVLTDYRFGDDETTSAGAVREEEEGGDEMTVIKSEEEDVSSDHNNNNTIRRKKSSSSDSSSSSQNTNTNKNDQQIFLYWIDYHHRIVREEQKREELAAHLIAVGNKRNSVSTSSSISSLSSRSRTYRLAHKLSLAFQPFTSLRWFPNFLAPRGRFYLPPPPQQRSSSGKKAAAASLSPTSTSFKMLSLFDGFRPAKTLRAVRYVHFICVFFNLFLCGLSTNASGLMEGGKPQMLGTHVGSSVLLLFTVALALNIRPYRDMMTLVATTIIEGCAFFILYSPAVTKKHSSRFRYLTIETTCVIVTVMMIVALLMSIIVWLIEYRSLRRSINDSGYYNDDSEDEDEDEDDDGDSHYKPPKVVIVTASPFASPLDTLKGDKNDDDHNKETRRRSREGQAPRVAFFGLDNEGGENDKSNKSCSFVLRVSGDATASSGEEEHQPHDENSDFLNDSLTQNNNSTLFLSSINADEFKKHFLKGGKQQQQQQQRPSASPDESSPTTNLGPEQHKTARLTDMSASLRKFLFGYDNNDNNSRKDDNTEAAAATSGKTRKVWSKNRTAEEKQALFEELHQSIGLTEDDFDELLRSTTQALAELENDVADDAHDDQEKTHENEKANDDDDDQSAQLWSPYEGSIDYTRNNNNKNKLFPHRADEEEDPERNHDTFNPLLRHKDSKAQQRRRSTLATMEQLQLAQLQQQQAPTKKTKNSGSSCDSGSLKHDHNHDNTLWSPPVAVKKSDTRQQQHRRSASADTFASASLSQSSLLFAASATTLTMQQPAPDVFERSKTDPTFNMSSASI